MMNRTITTSLAGMPMFFHIEIRSKLVPPPASCSSIRPHTCKLKSIVLSLLRVELVLPNIRRAQGAVGLLLAQREVHVDLSLHLDRLSVEEGRLVHPLFHRFESGRDQQRVAADHFEMLNGAVLGDDRAQLD